MDLIADFLTEVSSAHTRRAYKRDLRGFFGTDETLNAATVKLTTAEDVQSHVRSLCDQNLSEATQRRRLAALRSFFDWLIERGTCQHNPARDPGIDVVSPAEERTTSRLLTAPEVKRLITTAAESTRAGPRNQALVLTVFYGALRRGEVAALTVEDVRPLGQHWILDIQGGRHGKGGYVRIPDAVVEAIDRLQSVYDITTGPLWRSLSNRNRGRPLSPDALYKVVRRTAERAELDGVTIDVLRRTGLHLALMGGAPVPSVQAHGRFREPSSAADLHRSDDSSGLLTDSPCEYIDLDVSAVLKTNS